MDLGGSSPLKSLKSRKNSRAPHSHSLFIAYKWGLYGYHLQVLWSSKQEHLPSQKIHSQKSQVTNKPGVTGFGWIICWRNKGGRFKYICMAPSHGCCGMWFWTMYSSRSVPILGFFALGEFEDPSQMNTLDFLQEFHMSKATVVVFCVCKPIFLFHGLYEQYFPGHPFEFCTKKSQHWLNVFLAGPVAQDRPAKPSRGPRPRPVPAAMLAGRLNMPSPTTDLTWQLRGLKSSRLMKKPPPRWRPSCSLLGAPRFFWRDDPSPKESSKTWRWHNCGGWSHLLHMKPLW